MITTDLDVPPIALAVGAHPDDIEFGAAATLARWAEEGSAVHMLVLTDGSKGSWDPSRDARELAATRRAEQARAASLVGATLRPLDPFVDGELRATADAVAGVCRAIRELRPTVVLGHDPWRVRRIHPDHAAAGQILVESIVAARDPHFFADQENSPHRPGHVLFFESDAVNHVERCRPRHLDAKCTALLAHESQWESTMGIAHDAEHETERFRRLVHVRARAAGARVGSGAGEPFLRRDDF